MVRFAWLHSLRSNLRIDRFIKRLAKRLLRSEKKERKEEAKELAAEARHEYTGFSKFEENRIQELYRDFQEQEEIKRNIEIEERRKLRQIEKEEERIAEMIKNHILDSEYGRQLLAREEQLKNYIRSLIRRDRRAESKVKRAS